MKYDSWLAIVLLTTAVILAFVFHARAQDSRSHQLYHQFYQDWKDDKGASCCNQMDCHPAEIRQKGENVEVKIDNEWIKVPPEKIRPYTTPDMQSHVCNQGKRILCVSVGGGT